jgi:heptosyltransferase-3
LRNAPPIVLEQFKEHADHQTPLSFTYQYILQHHFDIKQPNIKNGIQSLSNLIYTKFKKRVIIHLSASLPHKVYVTKRFLKVAKKIEQQGFDCYFMVAPFEYATWKRKLHSSIKLPQFSSLHEMAKFIYESGFFIGSDSGLGHLASNLGLPTLTLFPRRTISIRWCPSWTLNRRIIAPPILLFTHLKQKYWKYFISSRRVYNEFIKLAAAWQNTSKNIVI